MSASPEESTRLEERKSFLKGQRIGQLKELLASRGVSSQGLLEKGELVDKVLSTDHLSGSSSSSSRSPSSSSSLPSSSFKLSSRSEQVGGLEVRVLDNRGGAAEDGSVGLLLLHGFGANKDDLAPFARGLLEKAGAAGGGLHVYLPQGVVGLGGGSFAWWPLDLQRMFVRIQTVGVERLFDDEPPPGLSAAAAALRPLLALIASRHRLHAVGGFSQGAMLAVDLALSSLEKPELPSPSSANQPSLLIALSGANCCPKAWAESAARIAAARSPAAAPVHVLQSHGTADPIVPFALGKLLAKFFSSSSFFSHNVCCIKSSTFYNKILTFPYFSLFFSFLFFSFL